MSLLHDIEAKGLVPGEGVYAEVVVACGKVRNRARPDPAAPLRLRSMEAEAYASTMHGVLWF